MARLKSETPSSIVDVARSIAIDLTGTRAISRFRHLYNNDRVAFLYDCLPSYAETIAPYQLDILNMFDDGASRVAIRGPHGLGKTFLASILVHHGVLTAFHDCKVPTTASAVRQLEKYLWPEIHKTASNLAWRIVGRSPYDPSRELLRNTLRLRGGIVEAFAVASDNHVQVEGAHATELKYILDEAKTIPAPMWDAIEGAFSTEGLLEPAGKIIVPTPLSEDDYTKTIIKSDPIQTMKLSTISKYIVNVFAISTPGPPVGRFYDIHMRKPGYEDWQVRHVTLAEAIAAGRVSPEWAANRLRQWGKDSSVYLNRVLGEFADSSEEGIIPLSWVRAAHDRYKAWVANGRVSASGGALGVDVARYGDDATVMSEIHVSVLTDIYEFRKVSATQNAGNIVRLGRGGLHIHIETDGGLGAAIYDILVDDYTLEYSAGVAAELLHPITVGGATEWRDRSGELKFADVRSAMWWNMRELLDPKNGHEIALPPNDNLTVDLVSPSWETLRRGVIKVEAKKEIKKRLGRSTDWGDSCCLGFWDGGMHGGGVVF